MKAVEIKNLHKTFFRGLFKKKKTEALKGINLTIEEGEIFCILGPNGSGKTTLINILSTLLLPDKGEVKIFGRDIFKSGNDLKTIINLCSGNPNFPWLFTIEETLRFYGMLYGLKSNKLKEKIKWGMDTFRLWEFADKKFDELSTGTKQRVSLAKSLLNDPKLLFLDEPTVGLDPDIAHKIRKIIKEIHEKNRITIILTTHYMNEAEFLSERIAFLRNGEILFTGTSEELKEKISASTLEEAFIELAK
ncbi:MAG: ABC transporter ATP-binding protein [Acidobacteriota bacterium]